MRRTLPPRVFGHLRSGMRSLRRAWWPVPVLSAVTIAAVILDNFRPITRELLLWWTIPALAIGFVIGVRIKRNDTSSRYLTRELQLEFYTAQDNRRLPDQIHPPWWQARIRAERERLHSQKRWQRLQLIVPAASLVLLALQITRPNFHLLPSSLLVAFILSCAGALAWNRLLTPSLLADLDELSRQGQTRGFEPEVT